MILEMSITHPKEMHMSSSVGRSTLPTGVEGRHPDMI